MELSQHVLIVGGTGFIGEELVPFLVKKGHKVSVFVRSSTQDDWVKKQGGKAVYQLTIDESNPYDAIINLAGVTISSPVWTKKRKNLFWNSRLETTKNIVRAIQMAKKKPHVFLSASGISIYNDHPTEIFTEDSPTPPQKGYFLQNLCLAWEQAAFAAQDLGTRVVALRIAPVLGPGGLLQTLRKTFGLGFGVYYGQGHQWVSWIQRTDLVRAIVFLLENPKTTGAYNLASPHPVTQKELVENLGTVLGKSCSISIPQSLVKLFLGEMGKNLLMISQRVYPQRLLAAGFNFLLPEIKSAIQASV